MISASRHFFFCPTWRSIVLDRKPPNVAAFIQSRLKDKCYNVSMVTVLWHPLGRQLQHPLHIRALPSFPFLLPSPDVRQMIKKGLETRLAGTWVCFNSLLYEFNYHSN